MKKDEIQERMKMGSKKEVECSCGCGETKLLYPSLIKGRKHIFINREHMRKWKTKTHEEFRIEMEKKFPGKFEIISKYKLGSESIDVRCRDCGNQFTTTPASILRDKVGCAVCVRIKTTKTHEEYENEIQKIWGDEIKIKGEYINNHTLILVKHNIKECGHEWSPKPFDLLRGIGCPPCGIRRRSIQRTRTQREFCVEMKKLFPGKYIILGKYVTALTPLEIHCRICGHEWSPRPSTLLRGIGCPGCAGNAKRKHDDYVQEINVLLGGKYSVEGEYINSKTKIEMKCNVCGHKWKTRPANTINSGSGCPECGRMSPLRRKTHEKFCAELEGKFPGKFEIIGQYKRSNIPIEIYCRTCGYSREVNPTCILNNKIGCPQCALEGNRRENSVHYIDGKGKAPYPMGWERIAEEIRGRDGRICHLCGKSEFENGRRLSVHHIDRNHMNVDECNLISLCKKCHDGINNGMSGECVDFFKKIIHMNKCHQQGLPIAGG